MVLFETRYVTGITILASLTVLLGTHGISRESQHPTGLAVVYETHSTLGQSRNFTGLTAIHETYR